MLNVTKFYAKSFDLDHLDIFWELGDFDGDIHRYQFILRRSEGPVGPFEQLCAPFEDQYYFRDTTPALLHKWRNLYYELEIIDKQTSESMKVGPTAQVPEPDLIGLEIMRQEDVLFREHVGRRCWLFPVRTFGAKCVCFDRVAGRRTKSNCLNCFDTGYLGGYLSPIECFVQLDPNANAPQNTPMGEQQSNLTSARLISFPPVKPKDILVEAENHRWRVTQVNTTQRLRAVVHQELVLKQIEGGDAEYRVPINISDLRALAPASERNFSNPQHVDEPLNVKDLLAVYGYKPRGSAR
jgi:hypothetical protein